MLVTVILCTYNRCSTLANALQSVAASTLPPSIDWEVLVVDNNSTDQTPAVVEEFCHRYPSRFLYLFEAKQGKSYALNSGVREARGDILAFVDDDVTVDPNWLWNLTAALHNGDLAGAGGRVLPQWPCSLPSWLPVGDRCVMGPFVIFDLGSEARPLSEPPFGTNMAFQKRVFERYGGFRTDLGPSAKTLLRNEDTEFGRRLLNAGEQLRYEPSALVHHPVDAARLKKSYLLDWWFGKGRSDNAELGIQRRTEWFLVGIPLYLFRRLAAWTLRWMIVTDSKRRFSYKLNVWYVAGQIVGCYVSAHTAKGRSERSVEDRG